MGLKEMLFLLSSYLILLQSQLVLGLAGLLPILIFVPVCVYVLEAMRNKSAS